jgi:CRP/FNR family transcriptional regulator
MEFDPNAAFPASLSHLPFVRLRIPARGWLFHAGQPHPGVYFVQAGYLRTSVGSADGRERITAFPMRGEWVGLEAMGTACHVLDCTALDASEAWHLPAHVAERDDVAAILSRLCATQLREQQAWALATASLCAERRVVAFLEDQGRRHAALGCSGSRFQLRMTRSEMGNFLALQIETVTRALTRLQLRGQVRVDRREITLLSRPVGEHAPAPPPVARDRRVCAGARNRRYRTVSQTHALK